MRLYLNIRNHDWNDWYGVSTTPFEDNCYYVDVGDNWTIDGSIEDIGEKPYNAVEREYDDSENLPEHIAYKQILYTYKEGELVDTRIRYAVKGFAHEYVDHI